MIQVTHEERIEDGHISFKPLFISWVCDIFSAEVYVEVGVYRFLTFRYMNSKLQSDVKMVGFDLFGDNSGESVPERDRTDMRGLSYDESKEIVSGWDREVLLVMGDTRDTLLGDWLPEKNSRVIVYLDGGHDYETVKSDFWNLYNTLTNGIIIMDDWVDPDVLGLGSGVNKYDYKFIYPKDGILPNGDRYRFWDSTWKFAKELHDNPNVRVAYVSDIFFPNVELEYLGIVVI